ncbi:MAG: hypothetical protein U1E02_04280 [Hydrogenophaga sp.]|nr:hypothetical protein [Hydrogenophaga sp.]
MHLRDGGRTHAGEQQRCLVHMLDQCRSASHRIGAQGVKVNSCHEDVHG